MFNPTWKLTDAATVRANQKRQLTPAQRTALSSFQLHTSGWVFFGVVMGVSLLLMGVLAFISQRDPALAEPVAVVLSLGLLVGVGTWAVGSGWWRQHTVLAEAQQGQIEAVTGEVVWHRGAYRTQIEGRLGHAVALAPGAYRFYHLPRAGYVLSAEALPFAKEPQRAAVAAALAEVFHADAATLAANRAGQITPLQQGYLIVVGLAWGGFGVALAGLGLDILTQPPNVLGWLGVALVGMLSGFMVWQAWHHLVDAVRRVAHCTTGHVTPQFSATSRSVSYCYQVAAQQLDVSAAAYRALIPGRYHVYYAPQSKRVLSVEPLA